MRACLFALPLLLSACVSGQSGSVDAVAAGAADAGAVLLPERLAGRWQVVAIGDAALDAASVADMRQPPMLELEPLAGRLSGFGGCNRFYGNLRLDGDRMTVEGLGSSKMYCEAFAATEAQLLSALRQTQRLRLEMTQLWLLDAGGRTLLHLQRDGAGGE